MFFAFYSIADWHNDKIKKNKIKQAKAYDNVALHRLGRLALILEAVLYAGTLNQRGLSRWSWKWSGRPNSNLWETLQAVKVFLFSEI